MGFLSGLLGSPSKTTQSSVSGFNSLPSSVQDFLLQQYMPRMQDYFNTPFQSIPMTRYEGDDPQMRAIQQYSDQRGGLFNQGMPQQSQSQIPMQQQPQLTAEMLKGIAGLAQYTMPYGIGKMTKGSVSGGGAPTIDEYIANLLSGGGMGK